MHILYICFSLVYCVVIWLQKSGGRFFCNLNSCRWSTTLLSVLMTVDDLFHPEDLRLTKKGDISKIKHIRLTTKFSIWLDFWWMWWLFAMCCNSIGILSLIPCVHAWCFIDLIWTLTFPLYGPNTLPCAYWFCFFQHQFVGVIQMGQPTMCEKPWIQPPPQGFMCIYTHVPAWCIMIICHHVNIRNDTCVYDIYVYIYIYAFL